MHRIGQLYTFALLVLLLLPLGAHGQKNWDAAIDAKLKQTLLTHKDFVSYPNIAANTDDMMVNVKVATDYFEARGFEVSLLESDGLPVFFAELTVDPKATTLLYYLHLDGQAVNPDNWDQEDPFKPVLKQEGQSGNWETISWDRLNGDIDMDWRIFGRAAADDKAPISMLLAAMDILKESGEQPKHNLKVILDLQEEAGSEAFLSTLEKYSDRYAADYMLILDGPAHNSNQPTLTFGCRGIARFSITTYGAELPQHSGHYGNVAPNPVFTLSQLLASMKGPDGRVLIDGYYEGIELTEAELAILNAVPDDQQEIVTKLGLSEAEQVAATYQLAMQYPSLNIRHIETSWKGPGLKTIIPEWARAHFDVRLVAETDGAALLEKIKAHIKKQGYYLIDRAPTAEERLTYSKIVSFDGNAGVNAFRTDMASPFGLQLSDAITASFGQPPVRIRTMGGTVPIIPAVNQLEIPAIIVPLVNMDNNQHNPNENIRIGNIRDGIKVILSILSTSFEN
ncbi:M20/M25/M40 family metallo-hydrolase [Gilvibacter sediminis]|uniref:M20/M25/M40 family metallo-hydrolase n=1 Tax=Gilvibacter sediminis TaxID=379071 RepID=UPI002350B8C9|nr:M20/M25/M40 family metallo-hydrolase [Gilvibacter sediminis]MDC7998140.1 M20/M25/M40 family metallo-hydrolase [Gilvibacter sediminis]